MLIMRGSYRGGGLSARPICDLASAIRSATHIRGANAGASRHNQICGKRRLTEEIASLRVESGGLFALVAPYLQWCLTGVKFTELEAASLEMRGLLPLRQKR
jgi:hypothetical protein